MTARRPRRPASAALSRKSLVTVRIGNVPSELRGRLEARAAIEGMSMSEFLLRELRKWLERPTRQGVLDRLRAQPLRRLSPSPADVIRAHRDGE
jgi:hypothetical protein